MSIKVFFSAFNIDDSKNKWGVRTVFLVLSLLMILAIMFPIGNPNTDELLAIYQKMLDNPMQQVSNAELKEILMCGLYLFSVIAYDYLAHALAIITAAVFIYTRHPGKSPERKKAVIRSTIISCLFLMLIFSIVNSLHESFYIIYALAMSYLSMIGCSYISGDHGFGSAFKHGFQFMKTNAPMCVVNFILVFLVFYFANFFVSILDAGNAYTTIVSALAGVLTIYKSLVYGRMIGSLYLFGTK
ncbi:MAG: hypothetical protein K6G47_04355 [Clostridia bacterium]|nr:hypothetical protein [Clostridia bacterium]